MKFPKEHTLKQIAQMINCEMVGEASLPIQGINEIHRAKQGDIVFVDHPKYYNKALKSKATVVLINKKVECPPGKALLISDDPFRDFVTIGQYFYPFQAANKSIAPTAQIGNNTNIQPNVFIGNHVKIGSNCVIHSNVSINDYCEVGNGVIIHSGTTIGSDGFYYKKRESGYDKLKSVGNVVLEDDVEIGANCAIDRGVTASTTIGKGTKIDNLVQIGHDTIIGKNCLIAAQAGIAGCITIEDQVTLWGQIGITSGITIAKGTVVLAQSGISKNTEQGKTYFGSPAEEARVMYKKTAKLNRLAKD